MSAKKVVAIILSTTLIALLAFCITWAVINFDAIKYAMSGTALYTKEDLDAAYEDGYNTAGLNNQDLQTQITSLRNQLDAKTKEYNDANKDYLDAQSALEKKAEELEKANAKVSELSNNASSLESSLAQAQTDLATAQSNYSKALSDYQTASNRVDELEQEVFNLNTTIKSYEDFKESVESTETVVATFEYNGAVILMQQYTSGATITGVDVPEDTDEIKFNGWTVDGQLVDLNNYVITQSTTFVADLTKTTYYTVTFYVDGEVYDTQKILAGATFDIPEEPTKDGFDFNGWTVNNETVDLENYTVSGNVSFVASFIGSYVVNFYVDDTVYDTQHLVSGDTITIPENPTKDGYEFKGWSVNGRIVDLNEYSLVGNTDFIAAFEALVYYTVTFKVGTTVYDTQTVLSGSSITLPDNPIKYGYDFKGWSIDAQTIVTVTTENISSSVEYIAVFDVSSSSILSSLDSGLYDDNLTLTMSWNEILASGFLYFDDNDVLCSLNSNGPDYSLSGILVIDNSVTAISSSFLANQDALKSVVVPGTIKEIPYNFGFNCDVLTTIIFCEGVETVGSGLGKFSNSLSTVVLPSTITYNYGIMDSSSTCIFYCFRSYSYDGLLGTQKLYYFYSQNEPTETQLSETSRWWHYVDGYPVVWE